MPRWTGRAVLPVTPNGPGPQGAAGPQAVTVPVSQCMPCWSGDVGTQTGTWHIKGAGSQELGSAGLQTGA